MVAVNYNFDIEKGSDFNISFIYRDSTGGTLDLTDKCVIFTLIPSTETETSTPDDLQIKAYKNTTIDPQGIISLTANNLGDIDLYLSGKETYSFNFLSALYDLDIRDLSGFSNTRIAEGSINIIPRNSNLATDNAGNFICDAQQIETTTPIPTDQPSISPTPTPQPSEIDFCLPYDCGPLDLFSVVYDGSGLVLNDLSSTTGSVIVNNTGIISNVELAINKLSHPNPSDLVFLLAPPSGDKILLSANSKISNYTNNFSFMFSNKASSGIYPHNVTNGQVCNIYDKTNIVNYNNENLLSSFSGLFGASITGVWDFIVMDTDPLGSGTLDSWKLIITYESNIEI